MKIASALVTVVLVGCGASVSSPDVEPTGARFVPMGTALAEVAHAQCARAQACGAVASLGIYRDASYCQDLARSTFDRIGRDCRWADSAALEACARALDHEPCTTIAQTLAPPPECRALCAAR